MLESSFLGKGLLFIIIIFYCVSLSLFVVNSFLRNVPRESEVIYVKYCKEMIRLRGERGEKGRAAANHKLDELGPRPWNK